MALPCSPWRRWRCALLVPTAASGTSHPRARLVRALLVPKVAPALPHRARVAVLRCVRLAVDVCFALPTDSPRMTGATRSAKPPKTERGGSVPNEFAPNLPRSVFRLRRASPPIHWICPCGARRGASPAKVEDRFELWLGQHRARSTARAAFGYSRGGWDSTRTLRGHFALAARIVRPLSGIPDNGRYQEITVIRKVGFASSGCGTGELRLMPVNIG